MPAELSGTLDLDEVLARLPHLTVHLVDLPERLWVADPTTLTVWVHKGGTREDRWHWSWEAGAAVVRARADLVPGAPPTAGTARLRAVPSR